MRGYDPVEVDRAVAGLQQKVAEVDASKAELEERYRETTAAAETAVREATSRAAAQVAAAEAAAEEAGSPSRAPSSSSAHGSARSSPLPTPKPRSCAIGPAPSQRTCASSPTRPPSPSATRPTSTPRSVAGMPTPKRPRIPSPTPGELPTTSGTRRERDASAPPAGGRGDLRAATRQRRPGRCGLRGHPGRAPRAHRRRVQAAAGRPPQAPARRVGPAGPGRPCSGCSTGAGGQAEVNVRRVVAEAEERASALVNREARADRRQDQSRVRPGSSPPLQPAPRQHQRPAHQRAADARDAPPARAPDRPIDQVSAVDEPVELPAEFLADASTVTPSLFSLSLDAAGRRRPSRGR